ncbi:hypothetical protein [Haladaptatus sp. GCM10025893]|uniref:hypothetical protein n=1 Tax=Haladaptatus sp. GCM10025893 TaxID=3252659 RepID=UPI00361119EF
MIHAWRAIQRVGEDLGLSGDVFDAYLKVTSEVHDEMLDEYEEEYDLDSEYFDFLNNEVLSNERVLAIISETNVSDERLSKMRGQSLTSRVPSENLGKSKTNWMRLLTWLCFSS